MAAIPPDRLAELDENLMEHYPGYRLFIRDDGVEIPLHEYGERMRGAGNHVTSATMEGSNPFNITVEYLDPGNIRHWANLSGVLRLTESR